MRMPIGPLPPALALDVIDRILAAGRVDKEQLGKYGAVLRHHVFELQEVGAHQQDPAVMFRPMRDRMPGG